jgi:hypothetical protein
MSLLNVSSTDLWFSTLKGSVDSYFLAVIALLRALPAFEYLNVSGFSSHIKESFDKESLRIRPLSEVHNHGAIRLYCVSVTEPCHLCNLCVVFLAKGLRCVRPNVSSLIQYCYAVNVIDSNWEKIVSQDPRSSFQLHFCHSLNHPVLGLIPAGDLNPVYVLQVFSHCSVSPRWVLLFFAHCAFYHCPDYAGQGLVAYFAPHPRGVNSAVKCVGQSRRCGVAGGERPHITRLAGRWSPCNIRARSVKAVMSSGKGGNSVCHLLFSVS